MKKIKLLFVLFFITFNLNAFVENFDSVNLNDFTHTDNINLSVSVNISHTLPSSLKISRNIKYDPSPSVMWTEANEVIYNFPAPADFSKDEYLIFWYYDDENLQSGSGASIVQIGLFDGDEWWYSTQNLAIGFSQMCIPLKALNVTNDAYIDGFCVPSWEFRHPLYKGNKIFNKGNIQKFKISFGAAHNITGDFYIDDIKSVSLVKKSIPVINAYISKNITTLKIYFEDEMAKESLENNTNVVIYNKTDGTEISKSLSYDTNSKILSISSISLLENKSYYLKLTNIFFIGGRRADSLKIDFTTQYPVNINPNNSFVIQDFSDGFYISIPEGAVTENNTISISTTQPKNNSLRAKSVLPANLTFRKNCEVVFFTDGYEKYSNLTIVQNKEGKWKKIPSVWYKDKGYIVGVTDSTGEFLLVNDFNEGKRDAILSVKPLSNPFTPNNDGKNDKVVFNYNISLGGLLTVKIFNSAGRLIRTILKDFNVSAGNFSDISWDGKDDLGNYVPDGIYIYTFILKRGIVSEDGATTEYYVWYENAPEETIVRGAIGVIR